MRFVCGDVYVGEAVRQFHYVALPDVEFPF